MKKFRFYYNKATIRANYALDSILYEVIALNLRLSGSYNESIELYSLRSSSSYYNWEIYKGLWT